MIPFKYAPFSCTFWNFLSSYVQSFSERRSKVQEWARAHLKSAERSFLRSKSYSFLLHQCMKFKYLFDFCNDFCFECRYFFQRQPKFWYWAQNWAALIPYWERTQDFLKIERERRSKIWALCASPSKFFEHTKALAMRQLNDRVEAKLDL